MLTIHTSLHVEAFAKARTYSPSRELVDGTWYFRIAGASTLKKVSVTNSVVSISSLTALSICSVQNNNVSEAIHLHFLFLATNFSYTQIMPKCQLTCIKDISNL